MESPHRVCVLNDTLTTTASNASWHTRISGGLNWLVYRIQALKLFFHFRRSAETTYKRKCPQFRSSKAMRLLDDDPLVDALKFLTRLDICVIQRVCRRLRRVVESDHIMTGGPYHRLSSLSIRKLDMVWDLKGCTWGRDDGGKPPTVKCSLKERLLLMRCMKRLPFLEEAVEHAVNTYNNRSRSFEKWRSDLYHGYLSSYELGPLPTSAMELRIKGKPIKRRRDPIRRSITLGRSSRAKLSYLKDDHFGYLFLLSDVCKYPMPPYVRVETVCLWKLPTWSQFCLHKDEPGRAVPGDISSGICSEGSSIPCERELAGDLRQWLYNSRESFVNTNLQMDVDKYHFSPWLLEQVFTRPSGLETNTFRWLNPPSSLRYCNTIRIYSNEGTNFNVDWIFEWLHSRNTDCAHTERNSGNGIGVANLKHLVMIPQMSSFTRTTMPDGTMAMPKQAILELLTRMKKALLEDHGCDNAAAPTFLISVDMYGLRDSFWDPFELRNEATGEKLVLREVKEEGLIRSFGDTLYKMYRCREEEEGSMMALLEQSAHKRPYLVSWG